MNYCFSEFLEQLYRGEYPAFELSEMKKVARLQGFEGTVPLQIVLLAVNELRRLSDEKVSHAVYEHGSASEYSSNKHMREHRFKHIRLKHQPDAKYSIPVTTSMAVIQTLEFPLCVRVSARAHRLDGQRRSS